MARLTGLEPATPGVTGRYSNQLSYNRSLPPASGRDAGSMVSALPRQALSRGFLKQKFRRLEAKVGTLIFTQDQAANWPTLPLAQPRLEPYQHLSMRLVRARDNPDRQSIQISEIFRNIGSKVMRISVILAYERIKRENAG